MYILIYFLVLGITTYLFDKKNEVETNDEFLKWTKKDILIMGISFLVSIILEILGSFFLPKFFLLIEIVALLLVFVYVNKNREKTIQEYKSQIEQIFDSISSVVKIKEKEGIDYNDLPFKIEKEKDKISQIDVIMKEPNKFNDGNCMNVVYSLKRYFPYCDWTYITDFPKQICSFVGQPLPPEIAKWVGSDLRSSGFIPLGVNGSGEVGMALSGKKKDWGLSSYIGEDGKRIEANEVPTVPQYLCIGSTGGGKAIWTEQEIW